MRVAIVSIRKPKYVWYSIFLIVFVFIVVCYAIPKTLGQIYISPRVLELVSPYIKQRTQLFKMSDIIENTSFLSGQNYSNVLNGENQDASDYMQGSSGESNFNFTEITNGSGDLNKMSGKNQILRIDGLEIINQSDKYDIDFKTLMNEKVSLNKKEKILLYNTHTSESYTSSVKYPFTHTDTYRIQDSKYNMSRLGQELYNLLVKDNYNVIFDSTPHDYDDYNNAYSNSKATINKNKDKYGEFGLMIDLHRDAIANLQYRPITVIENKTVAKIMIVVGIGTDSNRNQYWQHSLALALEIQQKGNEMYPGLFRALLVRSSKYNQDLNKNALLTEIGATGNTLDDTLNSIYYLQKVLGEVYN